jgi:hypothetical protein
MPHFARDLTTKFLDGAARPLEKPPRKLMEEPLLAPEPLYLGFLEFCWESSHEQQSRISFAAPADASAILPE